MYCARHRIFLSPTESYVNNIYHLKAVSLELTNFCLHNALSRCALEFVCGGATLIFTRIDLSVHAMTDACQD